MTPGNHDNGRLDADLEQLAEAYRATQADLPPPLLDQAVLSRARRAVERHSLLPWNIGWVHAVTTAAVVVLGLAIVMQLPEDPAGPVESAPPPAAPASAEPDAYRDAPTGRDRREVSLESRAAAGEAQAEPEKPPLGAVMPASALDGDDSANGLEEAETALKPAGVGADLQPPDLEYAASAPVAEAAAAAGRGDDEADRQPAAGLAPRQVLLGTEAANREKLEKKTLEDGTAETPASASMAFGEAMPESGEGPEAWLQRIVELKTAGDNAAAAAELERFRLAWPDYEIPAEIAAILGSGED